MKKLALLLAALVTLVLAPAGVASAADDTPRLHRQGRFLVDQHGRVVIVHGLNLVWKRAPYAPPDTAAGFKTDSPCGYDHRSTCRAAGLVKGHGDRA